MSGGVSPQPAGVRRCAVLGQPVAHSLSPLIHRRAYEVLGIAGGWDYGRHEVGETGLATFIEGCGPEWVGLSCTMPLKRVLLTLGTPSPTARLLEAANTFLFADARVENTDVTGLVGALARAGVTRVGTAWLLGNGATARSALFALAQLGVREVVALVRSSERAAASLGGLADALGVRLFFGTWGTVPDGRADLVVSTVSAPLTPEVAAGLAAGASACFDATYNHYPTELDRAARAAGVIQLSGIDLLVGQAVEQIRLMTGRECPPEPLLEVAYAALADPGH